MNERRAIPAEMRRQVLLEAGHRCAIHTCRHTDVEVHHIEPWSRCKEHRLENLIALCPNCHKLVESGKIDRKSLHVYKARLAAQFRFQSEVEVTSEPHKGGWKTTTLNEEGKEPPTYSIGVEYPNFELLPRNKAREVNAIVRGLVFEEVLRFRNAPLCEVIARFGRDSAYLPHCTFSGSFDVAIMKPQILSLRHVFTSYTGGAYSNTHFRSLTFQLAPEVFLVDPYCVFTDHYRGLQLLSEFCVRELCSYFDVSEPFETLLQGAAPSPENYNTFNVHQHGISIDFDEHQLGGKALGAPSVFVPYTVLKGEMNPLCAVYSLM